MRTKVPKLLYSRREIPVATSLSQSVVDRLLASGQLPSVVVGRRRLVRAEDLDEFCKTGTKRGSR
jgi:excisionase family DNA binding protein